MMILQQGSDLGLYTENKVTMKYKTDNISGLLCVDVSC